jgi:hypothetical protein
MITGAGHFLGGTAMGGFGSVAFPPPSGLVTQKSSLSIHSQDPNAYQKSQEVIEKIANAKVDTYPSGIKIDALTRTANKLPAEIPVGESEIRFTFALGGFHADEPVRDDYVIRHNLPGTYTVSVSQMTAGTPTTVDVNGKTYTRIPVTNIPSTNCWIVVAGPSGAFPEDWDIQFLRPTDEAAFDDDSKPIWHATRYFIPEFLDRLASWKPAHYRFMKALRTEESDKNTLAEFPTMNDRYMRAIYPLEMCVGLCNYIGMGGWFNFPMRASNDLIDYWCDFIIANMDQDYEVIMGHGNEHWNIGTYATCRAFYAGIGTQTFGTKGPGTISFDAETGVITRGAGAPDFTTLFNSPGSSGKSTDITFNGLSFPLDSSTVTADSMSIVHYWGSRFREDSTDVEYYYTGSNNLYLDRGYMYSSTLAMQRATNKFTSAGQMHRLTRMYEAQLANLGTKNALDNASNYWTTDYIDPKTMHDAVAINPYWGSGSNKDTDWKNLVEAAATAPDQAEYNDLMTKASLGQQITGVSGIVRQSIPLFVTNRMRQWRDYCDSIGFKLYGYEAGHHIIHGSVFSQEVVDMWRTFLTSSGAADVYKAWSESQIPYLDGPIIKFQFFSPMAQVGVYGMYEGYTQDESANKELIELARIRDIPAFWLPENPPVAVTAPDQEWSTGVQPQSAVDGITSNFTLADFVSVNATSFSGTPPAGTTLNTSTGEITGTPSAAAAADYTFTASNAAGSTGNFTINITVS